MKTLKELFLEKLHLDDAKSEDKNTCFKTSEEVANFLKDNIEGAKVKKVLDHGYSSASFKNWGDHGAYAYCTDVWMIDFPDKKHKIRVGMCSSKNKINDRRTYPGKEDGYCDGITKGDICFQTAVKSKTISGKETMSWNSDALAGYEPGTDLLKYVDKAYTGNTLKKLFKEYKLLPEE